MAKENKIKMMLHPKEAALIHRLRTKSELQYGKIEILTRDGIPQRILKTIYYDDLAPLGDEEL